MSLELGAKGRVGVSSDSCCKCDKPTGSFYKGSREALAGRGVSPHIPSVILPAPGGGAGGGGFIDQPGLFHFAFICVAKSPRI